MSRINIDDELRADPRFDALVMLIGRQLAYGALIILWDIGQSYWKREKSLIPEKLGEKLPNIKELLDSDFVEKRGNDFYCSGAETRWQFLLQHKIDGSKGGKASAEARRQKYGSAIPANASNSPEANPKPIRSQSEANPNKPNPSSSSSPSSSSLKIINNSLRANGMPGVIHKTPAEQAELCFKAVQKWGTSDSDIQEMKDSLGHEFYEKIRLGPGWNSIREAKRDNWAIANLAKQLGG